MDDASPVFSGVVGEPTVLDDGLRAHGPDGCPAESLGGGVRFEDAFPDGRQVVVDPDGNAGATGQHEILEGRALRTDEAESEDHSAAQGMDGYQQVSGSVGLADNAEVRDARHKVGVGVDAGGDVDRVAVRGHRKRVTDGRLVRGNRDGVGA